jgi:hypothetical protein
VNTDRRETKVELWWLQQFRDGGEEAGKAEGGVTTG